MIAKLIRALDPTRLVAAQRTLRFRLETNCGSNLRATSRANLFIHGADRDQIRIGDNALIDGTVEVYARGRLSLGKNFFLGRSRLYCAHELAIGDFVLVSDNVSIMDSDLHPVMASRRRRIAEGWASGVFPDVYSEVGGAPVRIEDDAWIGFGASVMKGVTIGQGAIVGAGSVVTKDVAAWTVVAGNPARVIRELKDDER